MMKKKYLIAASALLLAAPLAALSACSSTPEITLSTNWCSDTSTKNIPVGFGETLEYAVSFEKSAAAEKGNFSLSYPNGGTYTTNLKENSNAGTRTYVYTTLLTTDVQYSLGEEKSELLHETVATRVEFLDVSGRLRPLSSSREVHASAPAYTPTSKISSLKDAYNTYEYRAEVTYNEDLSKATYTVKNLSSDASETEEIKLKGSGSFFDNEQILLMLRAADLSSSMTFRTLDTTTRTVEKIAVKNGPTATTVKQSVSLNGAESAEKDFSVLTLGIAYSKANAGATQTVTYVQRTSRDSNTYRNVMLVYSYPVIYSHGTMTYRLTAANFYNPSSD